VAHGNKRHGNAQSGMIPMLICVISTEHFDSKIQRWDDRKRDLRRPSISVVWGRPASLPGTDAFCR
jgi:hypothetical protein